MASIKQRFLDWLYGGKRPLSDTEKILTSPDGTVAVKISLRQGHIAYSVTKNESTILRTSKLGFKFKNHPAIGDYLSIVRATEKTVQETWETVWGEEHFIADNYNELALYLSETSKTKRLFTVRFRAFNDGFAFRYEIPPQPAFSRVEIEDELTEFNVDLNGEAWQIPAYQPDRYEYNYEKIPVYELEKSVHTPLTIVLPNKYHISIHEAALYDYGEMTIKLDEWKALKADITPLSDGIKARVELPFNTPWRMVMIAGNPIGLTKNHIMLSLNDPPSEDFSWVKPIKFLGIWWAMYVGEWTWASGERHGASTEHALEYIDACRRLGIGGLLMEGWNGGWDGDWLLNGKTTDFIHAQPDCDLPGITEYARQNGIEIIGHHETVGFVDNYEAQLEASYKYYSSLGIHYIKPGYAGSMMSIQGKREYHHSQLGVLHYQKALELAAKYHICLDVHEPIKGTGIERTYPNLLTREGARGQEYEGGALSPSHACILPFTRLLSGPMDYTPGIFDITNATKRLSSTLARQLAYFVTIPSGMQMAADRPRFYEEVNPGAFKFIHDVPVNWETSVPIMGAIGEYYVVARKERGTSNWFVGGVTNESAHKVRVPLSYLDDGEYVAEIYRDHETAHYRDNPLAISIETTTINKTNFIDIWMAPGGGFAISLKKQGQ
ncbi:glycoside hydrolase family 97 protein [Candidatus Saccharibacteria bacterium]|nr:glycoside hydrolase family 97 protein [Candidatus Saccharibacteria bacterium]